MIETLLTDSQQRLECGDLTEDPEQRAVVSHLDQLIQQLIIRHRQSQRLLKRLTRSFRTLEPLHGVYLWGGVGIGKTFVMDLFYQHIPFSQKLRVHFHQFMLYLHEQLQQLQGQSNPLRQLAKRLRQQTQVLCLDEFMVSNITDAMLLRGFIHAIFKEGICLVATSNVAPDNLYSGGLQRELFLPTIAALKQHTKVYHLTTQQDYRTLHNDSLHCYFTPLTQQTMTAMQHHYLKASGSNDGDHSDLHLFGRNIAVIKRHHGVIWFDFMAICGIPRSQKDYLALTKDFHTILISDIPQIQPNQHNLIISFIKLIDVLYDSKTDVIISAAAPIHKLYLGTRYLFQFARTHSRIIEMQANCLTQTRHS